MTPKNSTKILLTTVLLLLSFQAVSQSRETYFDERHFDGKYLEHLIKNGIDSVRRNHNCSPLVNDSILYVAALDQSEYMLKNKRISHYQSNNRAKRTPQNRVEFYGAYLYNVGENVAFVSTSSQQKGAEFSTSTYGSIADALVEAWVNSPPHFKNIIAQEYEVTGLAIAVDTIENRIYSCQKFAHVEMKHHFEENKDFFPYSNFTPSTIASDFTMGNNELIKGYKYAHKLRHDKLDKCKGCPDQYTDSPMMYLDYNEHKGFVLRIENAEFVKNVIRNKNDGLAIEIVTYDDYACGNNAYYTKPSRRNGQLKTNGTIIAPKFREELSKGYKKRKLNKELSFFPYIFRKDSVNFFKRFGQFDVDKYNSEYFEIQLGKIPKGSGRIMNYNLLIIKDKQICDSYYFTNYCGELFEEYNPTEFIPFTSSEDHYDFQTIRDKTEFTVPFDQGDSNFDEDKILKPLKRVSAYDFIIDSVRIKAYSSIEGSKEINDALQVKRGRNISAIFQGLQEETIAKKIETDINWEEFRSLLAGDRGLYKELQQSNESLKQKVDQHPEIFAKQLNETRKGIVHVNFHVIPNTKSLDYYIKNEWKVIHRQIILKKRLREDYEDDLDQITKLYKYTHWSVQQGHLAPEIFSQLPFPEIGHKHDEFRQLYVLFGIEYPEFFRTKKWVEDSTMITNQLIKTDKVKLLEAFEYHKLRILVNKFKEGGKFDAVIIDELLDSGNKLQQFYENDPTAYENINKANFNLNMFAVNNLFYKTPRLSQENAVNSLSQIHSYYDQNNLLYDTLALKLAKMFIYFSSSHYAIQIIEPYNYKNETITTYLNEISYVHNSASFAAPYYQKLITDSKILPIDIWCNMFLKPCGIPFQAFDHEALRELYCSECIGLNKFLQQIYNGAHNSISLN